MAEDDPGTEPIRFEGVVKSFEHKLAVAGLELVVPRGQLFGLIGPNGAGKTTTIKMAVGLLRPSSGRVLICGHDVHRDGTEARRHLGYVPDQAPLYEKLTGLEMLELAADLHGVSRERRQRRVPALLQALDLDSAAGQLIQSYSRGTRQKLALCAALLPDPEVILLDEPTIGLDPPSGRRLRALLQSLCLTGHTVFLSTHALEVAEALCDRVGIFSAGRLLAVGSAAELAAEAGTADRGPRALEEAFMAVTGSRDPESAELVEALRA